MQFHSQQTYLYNLVVDHSTTSGACLTWGNMIISQNQGYCTLSLYPQVRFRSRVCRQRLRASLVLTRKLSNVAGRWSAGLYDAAHAVGVSARFRKVNVLFFLRILPTSHMPYPKPVALCCGLRKEDSCMEAKWNSK